MSSLKIKICGDVCPTRDNRIFFKEERFSDLLNNTKDIFDIADISIANLEFALTDSKIKAIKTGPILSGPPKYINLFKYMNIDNLCLANNHIKDYKEEGVIDTIKSCKNNNINIVGAGKNSIEAKEPLIIKKNGIKVGIIAFAEHEFNASYDNEAGANLFDYYSSFDQIKNVRKEVDFLIVLYHGGIEHYKYPSPLLQKRCRKMAESGADFITCQHSHVIGTEEKYKNTTILYGQGNTIYGYRKNDKSWNEGLIVNINLDDISADITYTPIITNKKGSIQLMNKKDSDILFSEMTLRSKLIRSDAFVYEEWQKFCNKMESLYLPQLYGKNRIFNKLNRILNNGLIKLIFLRTNFMITHNLIRCESHNEVVSTILKNK